MVVEKRMVIVTKSHSITGPPISTSAIHVDVCVKHIKLLSDKIYKFCSLTHIHAKGHDGKERFIVTEIPFASDFQACSIFWKIIYYQECSHIVTLNSLEEMDSVCKICYYLHFYILKAYLHYCFPQRLSRIGRLKNLQNCMTNLKLH